MKFQMILKFLFTVFITIFITACSISTQNNNIFQKEEIKEKVISYEREEVSEQLLTRVSEILQAMRVDNLTLINQKYIHPSFGFYNLYKVDGINTFTHQQMIFNIIEEDIEELCHLISRIEKSPTSFDIKIEEAKFNCSPNNDAFYGWNNHGTFLNASTKTYLSNIMKTSNKFEKDRYKKSDFNKAKLIEKTSYKVVVTPDIVFYVTKIEKNWYLTLFDRITTDCSK